MKKSIRVLALADGHSGHKFGLTHPDFDARPNNSESLEYKAYMIRKKMYDWYQADLERIKPVDILIYDGDAITGKEQKGAGTELIIPEISEQVNCASALIEEVGAQEIYMARGTEYHTTLAGEESEDGIAKKVKAVKIGDHDYLNVRGVVFDYMHSVGGGQLPTNQFAPLARDYLISVLWSLHDEYPLANVFLRAHRHYHIDCGGPDWRAMILPGLQASSKFGRKHVKHVIHFGIVYFDVTDKEEWTWKSIIHPIKKARQEIIASQL